MRLLMFGEEVLNHDPYNFNSLEEFIAHHFPELYEEIKELQDNEEFINEEFIEENAD